jgi:hypothetical protein
LNTLLYGERMLSASMRSALSYSYSPRLNFTFDVGGAHTQHLSDNQPLAAGNGTLALNSNSGHAGASFSYSLSPRTQISGTVSTNRTSSSLSDTYITTTQLSVARTVANHWILQGHGGGGVTNPLRQLGTPAPVKPYPSAGGSIIFKTAAHTLLASFDRSVNNSYGVGATTSVSASAAWRWRIPGRQWWIDSNFSWQQFESGSLASTIGWRSTSGFNQAVGPHLAFRAEYSYMSYNGGLLSSPYNLSESAVRFSVFWVPPANALR